MTQDVIVKVYDPTGVTLLATLARPWDVQWTDELNGAGVGRFTIHGGDAQATEALLTDRNIVKMTYEGGERFAFLILSRTRRHVSEDPSDEVITVAGPGVAALLGSAVIFPEYGTLRRSADARSFSYGAVTAEWYYSADWTVPVASPGSSDARTAAVVDWPSTSAAWIWPTDGTLNQPAGAQAWFRREFTLASETAVVIFMTADDGLEFKVDGETIVAMESIESRTWETTKRYETILSAGTHCLAARVQNQGATASPAGLLVAMHELNTDGTSGTEILVSDTSWLAHDDTTTPGWLSSHIFRKAFVEARDTYGVEGMAAMAVNFTALQDSASVAWPADRADRSFQVGTNLLELLTQLSERGDFDWRVGPDLEVYGWVSKGSTKPVTLAKASNLLGYETQSQALQATRLLTRTRDGWLDVGNTTAEAAHGTHYDFLSLGDVEDDVTATAIASTTLGTYAFPQAAYTAEVAVLPGAVPYVDYEVGDVVTAPGEWGGTVQLRVRALSMVMDADGRMRPVPEFLAV